MKYHVTIGGRERIVEVDGDRITVDGRAVAASLASIGDTPLRRLVVDGRGSVVGVVGRDDQGWHLLDRGVEVAVEALDARTRHIRSLSGTGSGPAAGGVVKAPMPGLVVRVAVAVGDTVVAGQGLVVLEAMKMENELKAPAPGVIEELSAVPGSAVEKGTVLVRIAPPA
jgi:pyruvate carboxylase subunit B